MTWKAVPPSTRPIRWMMAPPLRRFYHEYHVVQRHRLASTLIEEQRITTADIKDVHRHDRLNLS